MNVLIDFMLYRGLRRVRYNKLFCFIDLGFMYLFMSRGFFLLEESDLLGDVFVLEVMLEVFKLDGCI